VLGSLKAPS